jgi:large subunit ribosomal protein L13e
LSSTPKKRSARAAKARKAVKEVEMEAEKAARAVEKEVVRAEKAPERSRPRAEAPRPPGRVPAATVTARHGTGTIQRQGKGFSVGELAGAGMTPRQAAKWGARVDRRRRSVLDGNVAALKGWRSHAGGAPSVRKEAQAVERKAEEVVRGVEEGAEALVRETVRAERAVKRRAKKAAGSGKEKPRPKKKQS